MHIQTHFMSSWCFANLLKLTPKERFIAVLAGTLADLDGVTYIFGQEAYWSTHHVYGHNLIYSILLSAVLTIFCKHKLKAFLLFLFLNHLHLVLDLLGSGEGWGIPYLLPFHNHYYSWEIGWDFNSWQNRAFGLFFLLWSIMIVIFQKRTFLEFIMPKLDKQLVTLIRKPFKK